MQGSGRYRHFGILLRWLLWLVPVGLALAMALESRYNRHPDEKAHLDGFRYFSEHSWPPDLNADGIVYSHYGWSRVYTGQVVYWIYGRAYAVVGFGSDPLQFYRLLNVGLYGLLLGYLLIGPQTRWRLWWLAAFLGAVPQVTYLFSYANSDAWGIAAAVLLFAHTARIVERENRVFSVPNALLFGLFAAMLASAKSVHLLGLGLPVGMLAVRWWHDRRLEQRAGGSVVRFLAVAVLLVVAVNLPLKVVYPQTQGDWKANEEVMREQRAVDGFKPSNPHYFGYRLAEKGMGYRSMLRDFRFLPEIGASSYGKFGYVNIAMPFPSYVVVGMLVTLLLGLRLLEVVRGLHEGRPAPLFWTLYSGFYIVGGLVGLLVYCLHVDFQAQGRYLMPLVPTVYVLLFGNRRDEARWTGHVRLATLAGGWLLAVNLFGWHALPHARLR